jgi:hypothetical protein
MFPRDAGRPGTVLAAGAGGVRRQSRLRATAMVLPYVGILGGAFVLAGVPEAYFERLWWLAYSSPTRSCASCARSTSTPSASSASGVSFGPATG